MKGLIKPRLKIGNFQMNHSIYLLKQALAGLRIKKSFSVSVIVTLGISLGALLCILTLAYVMIAKPLPYPDQDDLYQLNSVVTDKNRGRLGQAYNYPSLIQLYDTQTVFNPSAMVFYGEGVLSSLPTHPTVKATYVTPEWFSLLGSKMALGRTFEQTEEKDSFNPVAILSYQTWKSEFNLDSTILDKSVTISGTNFRVVGVMADSFIEPQLSGIGEKTNIFLPWDFNPYHLDPEWKSQWGGFNSQLSFVGKLDSQATISQIEQTLTTPFNSFWKDNVSDIARFEDWSMEMELESFKNAIVGDSTHTVLLLLAGVIGLVLIACANITNLFMSRTAEQQRQLAIQAVVGASKGHLFQTLFAQSALLVFASLVLALIVASCGFWVLQEYLASRFPRIDELSLNAFTLGSAMVIALLIAAFFARLSTNIINYRALNTILQSSGKGTGVQVSQKVRQWLVISQVTIVTILVFVNIGLLKDSMKIINQPLGFETDNITTFTLAVNSSNDLSDEEIKPFMLELRSDLLALPQVEDVAQAISPLRVNGIRIQTIEKTDERLSIESRYIDDGYFKMTEQTLIEGDLFSATDFKDENKLIIINDVYAKQLVSDGSALGTRITVGGDLLTVSGVVKGAKLPTETEIPMRAYMLTSQAETSFILKMKPQQTISREMLTSILREVSSQFYLQELNTLDDTKEQLLFTQYTTAVTSAVLAVLTFLLAAIGLYGILNYATQMRKFELGTRLAIGASRKDVIGLIVKDNVGAVCIGIVVSLVALLGLYIGFSDALHSYVTPELAGMFLATLLLISLMVLFACYWPLRPIINTLPIHSLRDSQ
ncbi:ABC transporter permease [Thalassomonas actiniarum]|uniref:ABC transporter permease n=1 Tax=Thalassomonas actiniarum TaxID=485447 RepID=A0AAE9YWB7_9GAMM|nr:ABC transporter permease [Thalassomonas actiniarum]WDE02365.1 ABC transporter permease [Thalassomonas actiniarum]